MQLRLAVMKKMLAGVLKAVLAPGHFFRMLGWEGVWVRVRFREEDKSF